MKKIEYVIFYIVIIFAVTTYSQVKDNPFTQEYHKPYPLATDNQNNVRTIIVDNADDVWAGTKAGLFKFNKLTRVWSSTLDSSNQGPINDLFVDSDGTLWVAAWNGVYAIEKSNPTKIKNILGPIGAISEIEGSIIAIGTNGIWQRDNEKWKKEPITYSKAIRKIIPDGKSGYYLATGKGLYHKTKNQIKLFQKEEEILSDNIYGFDFTEDGDLWVGGLGGVSIYRNDKWIRTCTPKDGIPNIWVNTIKKSPDGEMWVGTKLGVTRFDGKSWSLRHSRRWLLSDDVRDIAFDKNGNGWIATSKGVSAIMKREMTLEQKFDHYYSIMERRHVRPPYLVESCRFTIPGDTTSWVPRDNDNDGQYTSMYLAMESYRYAVTKNPVAKENARKAFNAMKYLQTVTETNGFVARTVIPSDWKSMADANRTISDRQWAEIILNEPRESRIEDMWRLSSDGKWLWKRGTSSDEITGHMYGYFIYYELIAQGEERERVKNHILKIMDYIIDGGYNLIDIDGKHTKWGVWAPEYLNDDPDWATEKGINSLEILSYLKLAYHVSGDEKYQKEFYKLFDDHKYRENIAEAKSTIKSWITYIDDELLALAYPVLVEYETDSEVKKLVQKSVDQWYDVLKNDDNPYFYFLYNGFTGRKLNIERSIFLLQDNPLDLIGWRIDNSKREDLHLTRSPIMEELQTNRLVPPSERAIMRWDRNPWQAITGDGGSSERDGVSWMLAYWVGRYYGLIN
ncbi:MAG: regulator [Ignavibacteriae bacterium]|nr:regulator [Ignavibacteriota bacterium]